MVPLLNGGLWDAWVAERQVFPVADLRAAVRYLRLKPSESCRLVVFGDAAANPPEAFLLYLYSDADRARSAFEKETARRHFPTAYPPFLSEEHAVVGVPFPNDRELWDLRQAWRPRSFRRTVRSVLTDYPAESWRYQKPFDPPRLLAYKPGRRAVMRLRFHVRRRGQKELTPLDLHLKIERPETAGRSGAALERVAAALPHDAGFRVPRPMGRDGGLLLREWVSGEPLTERLHGGANTAGILETIGRSVGELHGLDTGPVEPALRRDFGEVAADLAGLVPAEAGRLGEIAERIVSDAADLDDDSCTVHGDLHPDQFVLEGDRPVLLDFDRAGRGGPTRDLAELLSGLAELGLDEEETRPFVRAYSAVRGPIDDRALRLHRAEAVLRRAGQTFRGLDPDWPARVRDGLTLAEDLLGLVRR